MDAKEHTIISWNVNGIRSNILTSPGEKYTTRKVNPKPLVIKSDSNFAKMLEKYEPDVVCFQEVRCDQSVAEAIVDNIGEEGSQYFPFKYHNVSCSTQKGRGCGYAGTAIWSKTMPIRVVNNIPGIENDEGRVIMVEFDKYYLITVYTPNSGTNEDYRINVWDPAMLKYITELKETGKGVILTGDMNVCHCEIDIYCGLPGRNERIAGLLPEEREAFGKYILSGFVDTWRTLYPDEDEGFTWWNPRIKQFRELNRGWRIDYALVSAELMRDITKASILADVMGSDHCPILLKIK